MFIVYIYVALASYNVGYLTLPLKSVECLVDEAANIAVVDSDGKIVRNHGLNNSSSNTSIKYGTANPNTPDPGTLVMPKRSM